MSLVCLLLLFYFSILYLFSETRFQDRDPFHESADTPIVVGVAHVVLERLAYMLELDDQFPVVDMYGGGGVDDEGESGGGSGQLFVAITPCNPSGKEILGEFVEDPMELVMPPFFLQFEV